MNGADAPRWAVTGAGGFVAQHLLPRLLRRGPVLALCRPGGRRPRPVPAAPHPLRVVEVELRDEVGLRRALAGEALTGLVHLGAAASGQGEGRSIDEINVDGAIFAANALWASAGSAARGGSAGNPKSPGRPAFVQLSTGYVYGETPGPADEDHPLQPIGAYARSKAEAEQALRAAAAGRPLLCLRAFNHAGPGQGPGYALPDWAAALASGAPTLHTGWLGALRDISDVGALAAAVDQLCATPAGWPPALNLCRGASISMGEALRDLVALSGRTGEISVIEGDLGRGGLRQSRGSRALADRLGLPQSPPLAHTLRALLDEAQRASDGVHGS